MLYKKGYKEEPGNFRLVSLTSLVDKLPKKILRNKTYAFATTSLLFKIVRGSLNST